MRLPANYANNSDTSNILILMFTAKSQVEDKVTGYEHGADDYLTKPAHPAELQAHIRSLLQPGKIQGSCQCGTRSHGGILAAKGGVGASTLTLNLAIAFASGLKKMCCS